MCVTADKTYTKINPLLTLVPNVKNPNSITVIGDVFGFLVFISTN